MAQLLLDNEAKKRIKEKPYYSEKYRKGVYVNNKKPVEKILNDAFVIEMIEQADFDDGSKSIVLKFHYK